MNIGKAVGGPVNGETLRASTIKLLVPVYGVGPDRGEGDHGIGSAVYWWDEESSQWIYQDRVH